ncbi:MAG: S4 domain-containing protein, partial [Flavobacteriales bacterium]
MTSRSDRGRQRTGKPADARPAPSGQRPATRPDGTPHSKRFGKRPPKAVRQGGNPGRPPRPQEPKAGARPGARAGGEGGHNPNPRKNEGPKGRPPVRSGGYRHRAKPAPPGQGDGRIRLNRYLSMSGVASRREADDLIKAGVVSVNGVVVTELGTKVGPGDKVAYGGQRLSREKKRYVLLNKPKDYITTTDDERGRRTVMELVHGACPERIYPVGRLDRNTTGLLL